MSDGVKLQFGNPLVFYTWVLLYYCFFLALLLFWLVFVAVVATASITQDIPFVFPN